VLVGAITLLLAVARAQRDEHYESGPELLATLPGNTVEWTFLESMEKVISYYTTDGAIAELRPGEPEGNLWHDTIDWWWVASDGEWCEGDRWCEDGTLCKRGMCAELKRLKGNNSVYLHDGYNGYGWSRKKTGKLLQGNPYNLEAFTPYEIFLKAINGSTVEWIFDNGTAEVWWFAPDGLFAWKGQRNRGWCRWWTYKDKLCWADFNPKPPVLVRPFDYEGVQCAYLLLEGGRVKMLTSTVPCKVLPGNPHKLARPSQRDAVLAALTGNTVVWLNDDGEQTQYFAPSSASPVVDKTSGKLYWSVWWMDGDDMCRRNGKWGSRDQCGRLRVDGNKVDWMGIPGILLPGNPKQLPVQTLREAALEALSGNTVEWDRPASGPVARYYAPNGSMPELSKTTGKVRQRKWWMEGDKMCESESNNGKTCAPLRVTGNRIELLYENTTSVAGKLLPGNPYKLTPV
jgi:hypothetical protein